LRIGEEGRMAFYALIMAGGRETQMWPLSRRDCPKQSLELVGERTMFEHAVDRIASLFQPEQIFIVTDAGQLASLAAQAPELPPENFIAEPEGRGTAPRIGMGAFHLRRQDPNAVMAVLTADHYIEKASELRRALGAAAQVAEEGCLVTLGIKPNRPATGYGYIERAEKLAQDFGETSSSSVETLSRAASGLDVYRVKKFTEKPDLATAQAFVESGRYYWNSGMFIWKVSTVLREFEKLMPRFYTQLMEIDAALGTAEEQAVLERVWPRVENETIDYGIMERAENVAVIPVDIGWSDVGSWATLFEFLPTDAEGNVVVGQHIGLDTRGCLIHGSHRLVTTIGLEDMIVVDTEDALLVCPRERAQEVRDLVRKLKESGREEYL